jgi:hypothetical protein
VVLPAEALPASRLKPGPAPGTPPPPSFLKHADEQTVAGLLAVYRAIHDGGLDAASMADWGVLAAPELLGRTAMAPVLECFAREGAWGISPHLIPHRSLHAVSGTISLALGLRGPNFGVGGGPGAAAEAFLAAGAMLVGEQLPGLWLVLTDGVAAEAGLVWRAAALALVPNAPNRPGPRLEIGVGPYPGEATAAEPASRSAPTPHAVAAALTGGKATCWHLDGGGWVSLRPAGAGAEGRP